MTKKKQTIKEDLQQELEKIFFSAPRETFNYKQLAKKLGDQHAVNKKYISALLFKMAKENILVEVYKGKFKISPLFLEKQKKISPLVTGRVDMKQTGKAYVITDDFLEDIRISSNNTGRSLHNDLVKVRLFPKRKDKKLEGEIIEIIERSKTDYVGTVTISKNFAFLKADSKTMPFDIYIPSNKLSGARDGEKVIVNITDWLPQSNNPHGSVKEVLGTPGDNDVEMHAILAEYGFSSRFPQEVEAEAENIPVEISPEEIASRRDFRDITTFTIDPFDAKDLDDALSVVSTGNNTWEIGVHIADVTHYVRPGSLIDKEGLRRATSVYLVDRTIPMLPKKLSNHVCSLNPFEDKLCYSVVFTMNEKGGILKTWIGKTIIRSNRRFSYEEVQDIIETKKGEYSQEISLLNNLAIVLRRKRMRAGSLDFERSEVKFIIDETGKPLSLLLKEHKEANKLIEEFMLLANKAVAEKTGKSHGTKQIKTFVYRIHDIPNQEKLLNLASFVSKFGYKLKTDTRKNIADSFNRMLHDVKGKGEENLIETLSIRSMAKAEYSTQNIGHYGLAFDYYSHFTSPIRRYPDMIAHRLLFSYSQGAASVQTSQYEPYCKHSSDMEKKAQEAERSSVKYKQTEYMLDKIGQEYEGLISGVSKWGIFIEIKENKIEGMVRLGDMDDDFYYLDEDNYQVIGHNTKKKYKLGDPIRIIINSANLQRKEISFLISNQ